MRYKICLSRYILLAAIGLLPLNSAHAAYQLLGSANGIAYKWQGTYGNRKFAEMTGSYQYDYGDNAEVTFPLSPPLIYNGQSYSQLIAHADGTVYLGSTAGPAIVAWKADLDSYYLGGVFVQKFANPTRYIVEWQSETFTAAGAQVLDQFGVVLAPFGANDCTVRLNYSEFASTTAVDGGSTVFGSPITTVFGAVPTLAGKSLVYINDPTLDLDGDGLSNLAEYNAGTTPDNSDSDGDGMPDKWEVDNALNPINASDALADNDRDLLTSLGEYQKGCNPRLFDSDGDGTGDGSDAFPLSAAEWLDTDGDGIGNNADLDDDGDGYADTIDALPLNKAEWLDSDGDGKGNNADTDDDNDGMPDTWEKTYGLNPLSATDAALDKDGDGLTNKAEYSKGSNPTRIDTDYDTISDPNDDYPADAARGSRPVLVSVSADATWKSVSGLSFRNPVVVANAPSYRDADPVLVRVRNVTGSGFEYRLQEWNYLDDAHVVENVSFLIMEKGRYQLTNGEIWEAGSVPLAGTGTPTTFNFSYPFYFTAYTSGGTKYYYPPQVLMLMPQGASDADAVTARVTGVTPSQFTAALYEQEASMGSGHGSETVGYIAAYSRSGAYQLLMRDGLYASYSIRSLTTISAFGAINFGSALRLQEEQSADSETDHIAETTGILKFNNHGIFASATTLNSADTFTLRRDDDSDGDWVINSLDSDDDNDGVPDATEIAAGTDPLNALSKPIP